MNAPRRLPGDLSKEADVEAMIRVDHAGEYGAIRIYAGQLAVLKHDKDAEAIRHMAAQEQAHLEAFNRLIAERKVRPTALLPLWHVAAYAMGAASALLGPKAAMACTVAVEEIINEHYAAQEARLPPEESALKATIAQFRAEEMEHHDTGLSHGAEESAFYAPLTALVRAQTKLAIWLSERW